MTFPKYGIAGFGVVGVTVMALLVALPTPPHIDPRTGDRIPTPGDAIAALRALGDASGAVGALPAWRRRWPRLPELRRIQALLDAEVAPVALPKGRLVEPGAHLLETLEQLERDTPIAAATEAFFAVEAEGLDARAAAFDRAGSATAFLDLAAAFARAGRRRAELRWLRRGLRQHPGIPSLMLALAAAYTAEGWLAAALAVTRLPIAPGADARELWHRQAELARWTDAADVEAEALEHLVVIEPEAATRRRLLALWGRLGRPDRAIPHALALAVTSGDRADFDAALSRVLQAGQTELALELLGRQVTAGRADYARLRQMVDIAAQDLQLDVAVGLLERMHRNWPTVDLRTELLAMYRRLDAKAKLAELLDVLVRADPTRLELGFEAVALFLGLGDRQRALAIEARMRGSIRDPRGFFAALGDRFYLQVPGLVAMTTAAVDSAALTVDEVPMALAGLEPLGHRPAFRAAMVRLLDRFPDDPQSRVSRLKLLGFLAPAAQIAELERLVERFPEERAFLDAWLVRVVGGPAELRARRALLRLAPADVANRERIAALLEADGQRGAALHHRRFLAEREGAPLAAGLGYARALAGASRREAAIEWIAKRVHSEGEPTGKLAVADFLMEVEAADRARRIYIDYLASHPDDAHALLRVGEILTWSGDAAAAVPFLRRRLAASGEDAARVHFLLAEGLWAGDELDAARNHFEAALCGLLADEASTERHRMIARSQQGLGMVSAAIASYRGLVRENPGDPELHLALVALHREAGELDAAAAALGAAKALAPENARVLFAEGALLLARRRPRAAIPVLQHRLELHGPDAATYAELGSAHAALGADGPAAEAYGRWFALRPDDANAKAQAWMADDRARDVVVTQARTFAIADDRLIETALGWALARDEPLQVFGRVGHGDYSAQTSTGAGTTEVGSQSPLLDLAVARRIGRRHGVAAGVALHPDLPGDAAGGWASAYLQGDAPYWSLEFRGHVGEVLSNPVAGVGLAGRSDGGRVRGFCTVTPAMWAGLDLDYRRLEVTPPGGSPIADDAFSGTVSLGRTWSRGRVAVVDPFQSQRWPHGPHSPYLQGPAAATQFSTWIALQAVRLRGDEDLLSWLPLANRNDYATLAARVDRQLATGVGCKLEGYLGTELHDGDAVWGADAELTWRVSSQLEASVGGGVGESLGRTLGGATSYQLRLQLGWRF